MTKKTKMRILAGIITSPIWIPSFVIIVLVIMVGYAVGVIIGALEYVFKGECRLLKEIFS